MPDTRPARKVFTNIHVSDITSYRLPPAGIVSILHRISGFVLAVLLPWTIWLFDKSLSSEASFDDFRDAFLAGFGPFPAFLVKLGTLVLMWGFLQHLFAGVRHLYMDITHEHSKEFGRVSALVAIGLAVFFTLVLGAKLFGLY
jgi:succinate dehydrogenase / fumarate reductase cytochrome b subunit